VFESVIAANQVQPACPVALVLEGAVAHLDETVEEHGSRQ
jgi:hypothetical protein